MPRWDVYRDKDGALFIDVRATRFASMRRLVLIPLIPVADAPPAIRGLNPTVEHGGVSYRLMPQYIASVPAPAFGRPIGNLGDDGDDVLRALDILFTGF